MAENKEDVHFKLFIGIDALIEFAAVHQLDRLETLKPIAALSSRAVKILRALSEPPRSDTRQELSSPDELTLRKTARTIIRWVKAGKLGVVVHERPAIQVDVSSLADQISTTDSSTGDAVARSALSTLASAIQYDGATAGDLADDLQSIGAEHGVPMLSLTELNALITKLRGDVHRGTQLQASMRQRGKSEVSTREFGEFLRRRPIVEVSRNEPYLRRNMRSLPSDRGQTLYLSTDVLRGLILARNPMVFRLPSNVVIPASVMEDIELVASSPGSRRGDFSKFIAANKLRVVAHPDAVEVEQVRDVMSRVGNARQHRDTKPYAFKGLAEGYLLARDDPNGVIITSECSLIRDTSFLLGPDMTKKVGQAYSFFAAAMPETRREKLMMRHDYDDYTAAVDHLPPLIGRASNDFLDGVTLGVESFDLRPLPTPAMATNSELPIFYPDEQFFLGLLDLARTDPSSAKAFVRHAGGQVMMSSDVRRLVDAAIHDQFEARILLVTEPLATPIDSDLFSRSAAPVMASLAHRSLVHPEFDDGRFRATALLALMAAEERSGWVVSQKRWVHDHLPPAFDDGLQSESGEPPELNPIITVTTMSEALLQMPHLTEADRNELAAAASKLIARLDLPVPAIEELEAGLMSEAVGLSAASRSARPSTNPIELGSHEVVSPAAVIDELVQRADDLLGQRHETTMAAWSSRAVKLIGDLLEARGTVDASDLVNAHIAKGVSEGVELTGLALWRTAIGLDSAECVVDPTVARAVADVWYGPAGGDLRALLQDASRLPTPSKRSLIFAIEESALRRRVESIVGEVLDVATSPDSEIDSRDRDAVDRWLQMTLSEGSSSLLISGDARTGLAASRRAMVRSGDRLTALVAATTRDNEVAHRLSLLRCIGAAASMQRPLTEGERGLVRESVGALTPSDEHPRAQLVAARRLLDVADVRSKVMRFPETRSHVDRSLEVLAGSIVELTSATTSRPVGPHRSETVDSQSQSDAPRINVPQRPTKIAPPSRRTSIGVLVLDDTDASTSADTRRGEAPSLLGRRGEPDVPESGVDVRDSASEADLPGIADSHPEDRGHGIVG